MLQRAGVPAQLAEKYILKIGNGGNRQRREFACYSINVFRQGNGDIGGNGGNGLAQIRHRPSAINRIAMHAVADSLLPQHLHEKSRAQSHVAPVIKGGEHRRLMPALDQRQCQLVNKRLATTISLRQVMQIRHEKNLHSRPALASPESRRDSGSALPA
jgi:hypothetical protein